MFSAYGEQVSVQCVFCFGDFSVDHDYHRTIEIQTLETHQILFGRRA